MSTRVLILSHAAELGGAELALLRLVKAMPASARSSLLFCCLSEGSLAEALRAEGLRVHVQSLPVGTGSVSRHDLIKHPLALPRHAAAFARTVLRVAKFAREERVELVQSGSMKAHLIGLAVGGVARLPVIWYLHDRISSDYLPTPVSVAVRLLARLPRTVLVNSRATALTVPRDTTVIYPGYSPEQASTWESVRDRETPDPALFLLLGRISPTKGQDVFVRAAAIVAQRYPRTRFRVVGSPMFDQEDYLRSVQALAVELGDSVEWVGFTDDPMAEIDRATTLVHASPVPEPFGQVVLEACVRGVPVIATGAGGVTEIVEGNAILVPPGDAMALAEAMVSCIERPADTRGRALAAYRRAVRTFSLDSSAQQMLNVWDEAVSS